MIKNLKVQNFKSFKDLKLRFGNLNFIIGANASGKSNLFDVFRFLQGVGNGFTLSEIIDGKPRSATAEVWEPIRGGSGKLAFIDGLSNLTRIEVVQSGTTPEGWQFAFNPNKLRVAFEKFGRLYDSSRATNDPNRPIFKVAYYGKDRYKRPPHYEFEARKPVLSQFAKGKKGWKGEREEASDFLLGLANMQRLDPWPALLRGYSKAHSIERMGEHGENFAALIQNLIDNSKTKGAYLTWLRHLRPQEVNDIKILKGAVGEPLFCLEEGTKEFPAPVLSDGTLRFAAIAAALFQPDMPAIMTIEEIENGIHASRLRLLVELLRKQALITGTQVFVTTHSPIVLAWLNGDEYAHTFFCKRDEESGESRICPLTEIPHFEDVVAKQPIGDLFAEGWMEAAL